MDIETLNRFDRYCLRLFSAFRKVRPGTGQTLVEVAVINEVYLHPGVNANKIACFLGVDSGYMTRIVKSLEKRGVVERAPSPCNHRSKSIFLTEEGSRIARYHIAETSEHNMGLLAGLDVRETTEVLAAMDCIMDILSKNLPTAIED